MKNKTGYIKLIPTGVSNRLKYGLAAVLLGLLAACQSTVEPTPNESLATAVLCSPRVSGSHGGVGGTTPAMAYDGSTTTYFRSSHANWQYLQIDFNCVVTLNGLRRYMSLNGSNVTGRRTLQGEGVSYSLDGVRWVNLTASTSTGWQGYVNYAPHAWHSVPYGWSNLLRPTTPVHARYVRFNWDGDNDVLNEVQVSYRQQICNPTVSGDRTGLAGTVHANAFDHNPNTAFRSSYNDWQYLQVDFHCVRQLTSLRRYMSRNGLAFGNRGLQGEGVSYSTDGLTWTRLTGGTSTGWQGYVNYTPHAWHSVSYGWSQFLRPTNPVFARYIRFNWDGNSDALNELHITFR